MITEESLNLACRKAAANLAHDSAFIPYVQQEIFKEIKDYINENLIKKIKFQIKLQKYKLTLTKE